MSGKARTRAGRDCLLRRQQHEVFLVGERQGQLERLTLVPLFFGEGIVEDQLPLGGCAGGDGDVAKQRLLLNWRERRVGEENAVEVRCTRGQATILFRRQLQKGRHIGQEDRPLALIAQAYVGDDDDLVELGFYRGDRLGGELVGLGLAVDRIGGEVQDLASDDRGLFVEVHVGADDQEHDYRGDQDSEDRAAAAASALSRGKREGPNGVQLG